jgi:hypothetical protein
MSEQINNQSQRAKKLKTIIHRLHEGASVEVVKDEFAELLADVGPDEIVRIEQALVEEGLDPEEIQPLCDVHVAIFREGLDEQRPEETIPGHPIFTYRAENLGVQRVLDNLKDAVTSLMEQPTDAARWEEAQVKVQKLLDYDKHYLRKENILFPYLERHDFSGPAKVMWGVHDEIREQWKALAHLLAEGPSEDADARAAEAQTRFTAVDQAVRDMIYKEENILFPAALQRLSDAEWAEIRAQGDEIGYCYARPGTQWQPQPAANAAAEASGTEPSVSMQAPVSMGGPVGAMIQLNVGQLSVPQIDMMLRALPVDVTFVDEHDEVRYFTQGETRIFQRSPAIIGRKVQNCHPPQSVDKVQEILDAFRAGTRDIAEFWIQMGEMFVHIRYFALRDAEGTYRGTIEVTQDIADIRQLEGEKRLLDD